MHKDLLPRDDIVIFYVSRKEEGRGLASIRDCIEATVQELKEYTKKSKEKLNTAVTGTKGMQD